MSSEKVENAEGVTPLMYAASLGHYDIVKFFLEHDCNPHHKSRKGQTAMEMAQAAGHADCAEILREYMAKVPDVPEVQQKETPREVESDVKAAGMLSRVLGFLRGTSPEIAK